MQVKVFEAEDMRSALEKVKKELGSDALILTTRSIHKTKFGFRGKPWIEVTAAVDGNPETGVAKSAREKPSVRQPAVMREKSGAYSRQGDFEEILERNAQPPRTRDESVENKALLRELSQMKQSFQGLVQEFSDFKGKWSKNWLSACIGSGLRDVGPGGAGREILTRLHELGVGTEVLRLFAETMENNGDCAIEADPENLDAFLSRFITDAIGMENPLSGPWEGQKRLAFIGPTGVGKTTTIAKIAANCMLDSGKKVALATIDNYRIAAVEQLKIYGQIMNVPVEAARTPEQLREIFRRHRDKDLILVDTAGRSPRDESNLRELAVFLDPALRIENHLVLSITTRESDLFAVVDRFGQLTPRGLVLTKLDECDQLGSILNIQIHAGHPLSFLTNGQKVPEDLLQPEPRQLARMILKRNEVETWNTNATGTRPERFVH